MFVHCSNPWICNPCIKSGIWAIPEECGAKQNAPIMRSNRAHRLLLAAQLRPSTSSREIKQIQARRQGASFKLKLEGFCLSFFYPKDKMTTMFNAPDGICQVSQTIQKTTAAQKVAQSHSGLLVVWFCQIYVFYITTTTTYLNKQN